MLAECPLAAGEMLVSLNRYDGGWEFAAPLDLSETTRIQIYTRIGNHRIQELLAFPHATIRELSWEDSPPVLLAVVHLPSKLWNDPEDQTFVCTHLARQLVDAEDSVEHGRLLVVGDFNINPFEAAMLSPAALNAESSRRVAEKRARVINGHSYRYFYNPMWNFFGDAGSGPGGTYFYGGGKKARVSWNIFDQQQIIFTPAPPNSRCVGETFGSNVRDALAARRSNRATALHLPNRRRGETECA